MNREYLIVGSNFFYHRSLAALTAGYSNADLVTLAQEAAMAPIREVPKEQLVRLRPNQFRPVRLKDFEAALCTVQPSTTFSFGFEEKMTGSSR